MGLKVRAQLECDKCSKVIETWLDLNTPLEVSKEMDLVGLPDKWRVSRGYRYFGAAYCGECDDE